MIEATIAHRADLLLVASVKRSESAPPAGGLRVAEVATFARREDRPDRVQLSVLAEQMPVTKFSGIKVPDAHFPNLARAQQTRRWRSAKLRTKAPIVVTPC